MGNKNLKSQFSSLYAAKYLPNFWMIFQSYIMFSAHSFHFEKMAKVWEKGEEKHYCPAKLVNKNAILTIFLGWDFTIQNFYLI